MCKSIVWWGRIRFQTDLHLRACRTYHKIFLLWYVTPVRGITSQNSIYRTERSVLKHTYIKVESPNGFGISSDSCADFPVECLAPSPLKFRKQTFWSFRPPCLSWAVGIRCVKINIAYEVYSRLKAACFTMPGLSNAGYCKAELIAQIAILFPLKRLSLRSLKFRKHYGGATFPPERMKCRQKIRNI